MLAEFLQNNSQLLSLLLITLLAIAAILYPTWRRKHRRQLLRQKPFPKAWRKLLQQRWPLYRALPADLQQELRRQIQRFIAEVEFVGCDGLSVTEPMQVLIAAQACLLTLKLPVNDYPGLRQVLVYPRAFWVLHTHPDEHGLVHGGREARVGESWDEGQVILAWDETRDSARIPDDAFNVVLHEFAHQLDAENGLTNGAPELGSAQRHARWAEVMRQAFVELQAQVARGEETVLDPYGASEPAEFFAVATEAFFERGQDLRQTQPAVYAELAGFYHVDPAAW